MIGKKSALVVFVLLLGGCTMTARAGDMLGDPAIVLDGTDVYDAASYTLLPLDATAAGNYVAEQGGSVLSLQLHASDAGWKVERTYREPGSPAERRSYEPKMVRGVLMTENGDLEIHRTTDGLLVLERASGGSIPPDYWVLYVSER